MAEVMCHCFFGWNWEEFPESALGSIPPSHPCRVGPLGLDFAGSVADDVAGMFRDGVPRPQSFSTRHSCCDRGVLCVLDISMIMLMRCHCDDTLIELCGEFQQTAETNCTNVHELLAHRVMVEMDRPCLAKCGC